MTAYATLTDLQNYIGAPPVAGDDRLLVRASKTVDVALIASVYDVDDDGNPTDPTVIAAIRDAVCAQVESWKETGDERGDLGQWQEMQLGPARLVRRASNTANGALPGVGIGEDRLCPRALEELRAAGLWPGRPTQK